jgi:hypothetical protein
MQRPLSGYFIDPEPLRAYCREVAFPSSAILRTEGRLSIDMYLLTDGEVEVSVGRNGQSGPIATARRGAPIGEIGFLTGVPATATVTAKTASRALYIDDPTWREIERREPALAIELYRKLAEVADGRQSYNLRFLATGEPVQPSLASKVVLCRTPEQLLEAQRIRYEVYCEELGRTSPFADAQKKVIAWRWKTKCRSRRCA